jgi:ParB family chromosome partitioning protein
MSASRVDALASIELNAIRPNPNNPRAVVGDVTELAASIREQGLVQPLVVGALPDGTFQLIAGHRRYAALDLLGADRALCVVRTAKDEASTLAMMLVENGQRVQLTPLEEARAMQRLRHDHQLSQAAIAKLIGKSQTHVSQRLGLMHLTKAEQAELERGDMLVRDAVQTSRVRRGTAKDTKFTGWHLGKTHPLADTVRSMCRGAGHSDKRLLGGMGCGQCWEQAIRADERGAA